MAIFSGMSGFFKRTCTGHKLLTGMILGAVIVFLGFEGVRYTSTDRFCAACHVHPDAISSWKLSTHYKNKSGVATHCEQCHLPPGGLQYFKEKTRLGLRDVYGTVFKDTERIDWEERSALYHAVTYTFDNSCLSCHADLYSLGLSDKGVEAHEHYQKTGDKIYCINCHKTVGHFHEAPVEIALAAPAGVERKQRSGPLDAGKFESYTEVIPGTDVTFEMVALAGGTFLMGSPEPEPYREPDEGPVREVALNPFWMGETEVTWNEYRAYFNRTSPAAKKDSVSGGAADTSGVDATTGPTPKYGSMALGGWQAAYSMTHYAATRYCEWLSEVTGKKFRLPTEAEWEYAARAGTTSPYFFAADPGKLTGKSWLNRIRGIDDGVIGRYVYFYRNSGGQVHNPYTNEPNPWGIYNMLGNVKEFCLDYYAPDAYWLSSDGAGSSFAPGPVADPTGPASGQEHVVRGGSYLSDPADLRAAARGRTHHDAWLITDPHKPKSKWWYSDCMEVGFRVVREYQGKEEPPQPKGSE